MSEPTVTMKMRGRPVTHEEAQRAAQRLINSHFNNGDHARCSIPCKCTDDDVTVSDYIHERAACEAEAKAALEAERAKVQEMEDALLHATDGEENSEVAYNNLIEGGRKKRAESARIDANIDAYLDAKEPR